VKLDHVFALTDNNALLQHAKFSVLARREGYAVDDNARALVFAVKAQALWPNDRLAEFQRKMIAFLLLMQAQNGTFHNLMDFSQRIIDEPTAGDHLGRAIWAAGTMINSNLPRGMKAIARLIFDRALPWAREATSTPRTKAYACLGTAERLHTDTEDRNLTANLKELADNLFELCNGTRTPGWDWFEDILSYDNPRLSQALFAAYQSLGERKHLDAAQKSLEFLQKVTTIDDIHVPIGSSGWYVKGGERALYDQQPIDAGAMVETSALACRINQSSVNEKILRQALGWFFGLNTKSVNVYDATSGACCDGITPDGLNENQGAESTVAFLLAATAFIENLTQSPKTLR